MVADKGAGDGRVEEGGRILGVLEIAEFFKSGDASRFTLALNYLLYFLLLFVRMEIVCRSMNCMMQLTFV